jgi:hypothetical protein
MPVLKLPRVLCLVTPLLAFGAVPGLAFGQTQGAVSPNDDEARRLKDQGNAQFDLGELAKAMALYEEAERKAQSEELKTTLLYNKARVQEKQGNFVAALANAQGFEQRASPELKAKVPNLAQVLANLRSLVTNVELILNVQDARVRVDQVVVLEKAKAGKNDIQVAKGDHTLTIEADGYYTYGPSQLAATGGNTLSVPVELSSKATRGLLVVNGAKDASIGVDGVDVGFAPARKELPAGSHEITAKRPDSGLAKRSIVIAAGQTLTESFTDKDYPSPSIFTRWWFWTGIAVVVAGGVALTIALTTEKPADRGSISPFQIKTAGIRF